MKLSDCLTPARIACHAATSSKKRALELVGTCLAAGTELSPAEAFEALIARERLGSTAMEKGIAIPHGRSTQITVPTAAVVRLEQGVDYDAPDQKPVDLLFALLAPREGTQEHLDLLAEIAGICSNRELCEALRACSTPLDIYQPLRAAPPG